MMKSSLILSALAIAINTAHAHELRGAFEQQLPAVGSSNSSHISSDFNDEFAPSKSSSDVNDEFERAAGGSTTNSRNNRRDNVDKAVDRSRNRQDNRIDNRRDSVDRAIDRSRNRQDDRTDNDDRIGGGGKRSAAQKRQGQRDTKRARDNPDRDQRSEERERIRKNNQSRSRNNPCADPSDPDPDCGNANYPGAREAKRVARCNRNDESCNYHRVAPRNEPNGRRAVRDTVCIRNCVDDNGNGDQADTCIRKNCAMVAQE